jgi:prevent-host-death family protein
MKKVALATIKDDLSRYLHVAEKEEVLITRHGRPAGLLVGFATEDDWLEYRFENDPRFAARIASARADLRAGLGTPIEELDRRPASPRKRRMSRKSRGARTRRARRTA